MKSELTDRLRNMCATVRTNATPLADLIPMIQQAADSLDALAAERDALRKKSQENELMAECTVMLRDDLIEAGIVDKTVPPMMLTEAVLAHVFALRKDAERYRLIREDSERWELSDKETGSYPETWHSYSGPELDSVIDAAMAKEPK